MDAHYEQHWHAAMELKHQTHDLINDASHPMARTLHHESSQLVEDIEMQRQPRAIEERILVIQRQLRQARAQGVDVMSTGHNSSLHKSFEHLREGVRSMPHY